MYLLKCVLQSFDTGLCKSHCKRYYEYNSCPCMPCAIWNVLCSLFLKGRLHWFSTCFLWFWFGEYMYMNSIKLPSDFPILGYHKSYLNTCVVKTPPDGVIGKSLLVQMMSSCCSYYSDYSLGWPAPPERHWITKLKDSFKWLHLKTLFR